MSRDHDQRHDSRSATVSEHRYIAPGRTTASSRIGHPVQRAATAAPAPQAPTAAVSLDRIDTWWSLATGTAPPEQYARANDVIGPMGETTGAPVQRARASEGAAAVGDPFGLHLDVQLREAAESGREDPGRVHQLAREGVAGSGGALPFLDEIQRSFGPAHDMSGVRAHVGTEAARAARGMGAHAYTTGDQIAFAAPPGLALAAHEAAHVVQQRGGVQLKAGVGQVGDSYEQHADAVAERVVRGESAADLLGGQSVHDDPPKSKAACSACGGAPAGTGDCPACKATQAMQLVQSLSSATVQRECDPSIASCPFEDPGESSSSSEPNASFPPAASSSAGPAGSSTSGGANAATPPPAAAGALRYPNQTCTNEVLDALQAAMHIACDTERSTCNPNKVSQKRLDRLDCDEVARRLAANRACLEARRLIQTTCFGGAPDPRHVVPLEQAERAVQHCDTLLQRCRQRQQPQPVPVPVPVPVPAPAPEPVPAPAPAPAPAPPQPAPQPDEPNGLPTLDQVLEVLAILGLSLLLAVAIVAALADPEPASKVALAVGSAALALVILQRLGIRPEPGFEGA